MLLPTSLKQPGWWGVSVSRVEDATAKAVKLLERLNTQWAPDGPLSWMNQTQYNNLVSLFHTWWRKDAGVR
jgi:hypothetical protein